MTAKKDNGQLDTAAAAEKVLRLAAERGYITEDQVESTIVEVRERLQAAGLYDRDEASLEVVLPAPTCINRLMLQEYVPLGQRIRSFEVQVWRRDGWHTVAEGTTVGARRTVTFPTRHQMKV